MGFFFSKDEQTFQPFKAIDYAFGLLVFFVAFGVYLHTLTPTVGFHDSGELITVAWTLGIAHPPGYPLYTLFGKVFTTLIPIGNIAFRMNIESALFASLAVIMVYFITLKLSTRAPEHQSTRIIPSIVASLILAFSLTFWEQAVIAEKYTLNAFFATLLIFILLKWKEAQSSKLKAQNYLYLFFFVLGLSFTHHFQTIYLVPASVFFILATLLNRKGAETQRKKLRRGRFSNFQFPISNFQFSIAHCSLLIALFILPLILWFYLPLRASQEPVMNWGNPNTLDRFVKHVTGSQYQHFFLKLGIKDLISHLGTFIHLFNPYFFLLGFTGFIFLMTKRWIFGVFLFLIFITNILSASHYDISNIEDYYIPSFIFTSIFTGYCIYYLLSKLNFRKTAICSVFLILPLIQYKNNCYSISHFNHYLAYDYGRDILKVKKKAVLFLEDWSPDEPVFYLKYLQYIEGLRKDIKFIEIKHVSPFLIESNLKNSTVYLRVDPNVNYQGYLLIPEGIFRRVVKANMAGNKDFFETFIKNKPRFTIREITSLAKRKITFGDMQSLEAYLNYCKTFYDRGCYYYQFQMYDYAIIELKDAFEILRRLGIEDFEKIYEKIKGRNYASYLKTSLNLYNEIVSLYTSSLIKSAGIFYNKKLFNKAIPLYKMALEVNPNNTYAKNMFQKCKM